MAGASSTYYEFNNMVRGQHIYKSLSTPFTDKCIMLEDSN